MVPLVAEFTQAFKPESDHRASTTPPSKALVLLSDALTLKTSCVSAESVDLLVRTRHEASLFP